MVCHSEFLLLLATQHSSSLTVDLITLYKDLLFFKKLKISKSFASTFLPSLHDGLDCLLIMPCTGLFLYRLHTSENHRFFSNITKVSRFYVMLFNSFHATGLFLYPLKTSENQRFSDVFRGYRKRPMALNELKERIYYYFN